MVSVLLAMAAVVELRQFRPFQERKGSKMAPGPPEDAGLEVRAGQRVRCAALPRAACEPRWLGTRGGRGRSRAAGWWPRRGRAVGLGVTGVPLSCRVLVVGG